MTELERRVLQQYTLQGVRETGDELGRGSYAAVYTVEYKGLPCAAKKLHQALYEHGIGYAARRFQEECALLSRLRHPNIVQFLGVYHQPGSMFPALVMEYLPMTLAECLDQYGVLPNEIGYSILKDVALALSYLQQHDPPIIHRDLSANNVLLTCGMTAKISDLGVAKILDLNPMQMRTMTQTPGTQCYMPPEAQVPRPRYSTKVDVFSFGVMMVHLFSGQWPFPTEAAIVDPQDDSRMIPQSEADRRQEKLDAIGRDHPLMTLILRCLHNSLARRPEAVEILTQVSRVAAQFPPSSRNKVELLQQVTSLRERLQREREHEAEIQSLRANTQRLQQANRSLRLQQGRDLPRGSSSVEVETARQASLMDDTRDKLETDLRTAQQEISSKNSALSRQTGQMAELRQEVDEKETENQDLRAELAQYKQRRRSYTVNVSLQKKCVHVFF